MQKLIIGGKLKERKEKKEETKKTWHVERIHDTDNTQKDLIDTFKEEGKNIIIGL